MRDGLRRALSDADGERATSAMPPVERVPTIAPSIPVIRLACAPCGGARCAGAMSAGRHGA